MRNTTSKSKSVLVPVRLDNALRERLRFAARRLGTNIPNLIRFAVAQQLQQIEIEHGGIRSFR